MTKLSFQNLFDANQINESDLSEIFALADKFRLAPKTSKYDYCQNLIMASLFFEPSTRTRFSFESAMMRLGGNVISLEQGESSSVKKGESLSDMGRVVSNYADVIVMRHPQIGSVAELARFASVPVINAGDGANQHPTQSLIDVYTILCQKKRLNNLKIGIVGDLKYGRTIHSLLELMSRHSGNQFVLISHPSLMLDAKKKAGFESSGCKITESHDLQSAIDDLDVLYMSRIQQERFSDIQEYEKIKDAYLINKNLLEQKARQDMIVLHALPRINEIATDIDNLPQAKYFEQASYGIFIRMALLSLMCGSF